MKTYRVEILFKNEITMFSTNVQTESKLVATNIATETAKQCGFPIQRIKSVKVKEVK